MEFSLGVKKIDYCIKRNGLHSLHVNLKFLSLIRGCHHEYTLQVLLLSAHNHKMEGKSFNQTAKSEFFYRMFAI